MKATERRALSAKELSASLWSVNLTSEQNETMQAEGHKPTVRFHCAC